MNENVSLLHNEINAIPYNQNDVENNSINSINSINSNSIIIVLHTRKV